MVVRQPWQKLLEISINWQDIETFDRIANLS